MIKRMEPLAEENQKLKEAMNLLERNTQRAGASETSLNPTRGTWNTRRESCLNS